MALAPGARLGPYEIIGPLGSGGMGDVYRARDSRLNRVVAIKVLPDAAAADPDRRERFEREARAISALDHPNICPLYDVGEHDYVYFLVMPCLDGQKRWRIAWRKDPSRPTRRSESRLKSRPLSTPRTGTASSIAT
jgi:serine/threonine protein kinase